MARRGGVAALVWVLLSSRAAGQVAYEEHQLDFQAKRVEVADEDDELALSGDVVLRAHRFRLTAERITLSRSPRGVHVEGAGRLSFCPCPGAPVTLGFAAADLAPPTDVLLEHATVRLYGVPIFYSPYLWLRAPTRPGLLPPEIAYRGEEGLLLGTGVHWPIAPGASRPVVLDLGAHGYVRGGTRLTGELSAPAGRVVVGWDHIGGTALGAEGSLAGASTTGATFAGRFDVLRGERALVAPISVSQVARRMDRLRVSVGRVASPGFGISLIGASPRGSALDHAPEIGPLLELGQSVPLGPGALAAIRLETQAFATERGDIAQSALYGELNGAVAAGPTLNEVWLRPRLGFFGEPGGQREEVEGEARARFALPLARRFGAIVHRLEPVLEGAVELARGRARGSSASAGPPEQVTLLTGLETSVGAGREAADMRLMGGLRGRPEEPRAVLAARTRLAIGALGFEADARAVPSQRAVEVSGRAYAGRTDTVGAQVHVQGRHGDAVAALRLFHDDWLRPEVPWLATPGFSGGAALRVPWGLGLSSQVGVELDLTEERLLGATGTLGYRHACDCLGVFVDAGRRLGRAGLDVTARVDLIP